MSEAEKQNLLNQFLAPIKNLPANMTVGQLLGALQAVADTIYSAEAQGIIEFKSKNTEQPK